MLAQALGLIVATAWMSGCATSERQAARKLDRTQEVIQHVSDLYAADKELSGYPITVDGFKNALRLNGQVATETQRQRAEKILWAIPGVQSVENRLEVRPQLPAKAQPPAQASAPLKKPSR